MLLLSVTLQGFNNKDVLLLGTFDGYNIAVAAYRWARGVRKNKSLYAELSVLIYETPVSDKYSGTYYSGAPHSSLQLRDFAT